MLSDDEVRAFVDDGFVVVRDAVPRPLVAAYRSEVEDALRDVGADVDDPSTWTAPVARTRCPLTPAGGALAGGVVLREAYDQLLGRGGWIPRPVMVGAVIARFPHAEPPWDAGWHADGGWQVDGEWWLDVASHGRGLLVLFLLSDVSRHDAPTELKVGSHHLAATMLADYGADGVRHPEFAHRISPRMADLPTRLATGRAGDVVICHPFLVHGVNGPNPAVRPRIITQVLVESTAPFPRTEVPSCPVAEAIARGVAASAEADGVVTGAW